MPDYVIKHRFWLLFALLLPLCYFPIFLHLDFMPIRMWDESIMGVNAIEMADNHNYIVTYFFGTPDNSNCKPPLMIWCIVALSKIFGFSELSLRLPSALAALALCIFLFFSLRKYTGSMIYAFMVVCILITSQGYVRNHVIRTGEYDSLLVMFSTIFSLSLFFAVEAGDKAQQSKHLLLFFIFLTLAVLTKGVACLMQAPGLFIFVLINKKLWSFLKNKTLYIGLAIFIVFGLGYYFLRESLSPGYLQAVWINELGGRFAGTIDNHQQPIYAYVVEIATWPFSNYIFLLPFGLLIGLRFSESPVKRLVLFSIITGGFFLLVISLAQTKLGHYDAPVFPYLAMITAPLFLFIYNALKGILSKRLSYKASSILAFLMLLSVWSKAYKDIVEKVYFPKGDFWEEGFAIQCKLFQHAVRGEEDIQNYKLVTTEWNYDVGWSSVMKCYRRELEEHHINAPLSGLDEIDPGDKLIIFEPYLKQLVEQKFEVQYIKRLDYCNADVVHLKAEKPAQN